MGDHALLLLTVSIITASLLVLVEVLYQNLLGIDIATNFVSFVQRQYPDNTKRQVEALHLKPRAFTSMLGRSQPVQMKVDGITANVLLSLIDRMKNESPLTRRYSLFEASAHGFHGQIALDEGTEESAKRDVVHFENALEVYEAIGDDEGIAMAQANIAIAKSKYEGGNNEEVLKASKELYDLRIAEFGEENGYTICAGKNYALRLQKANRGDEAGELLTKLLATSMQVLGPHHNITKEVELLLSQ